MQQSGPVSSHALAVQYKMQWLIPAKTRTVLLPETVLTDCESHVQHQHVLCTLFSHASSNSVLSTWIRYEGHKFKGQEATMVQLCLQPCDWPVISVVPKGGMMHLRADETSPIGASADSSHIAVLLAWTSHVMSPCTCGCQCKPCNCTILVRLFARWAIRR